MVSSFDITKLTPFLIFILGVLFSPIIESIKERFKSKRLKQIVISSLNDELDNLSEAIQYTIQTIELLRDKGVSPVRLHAPINISILEKYFIDIYPSLTKDQRKCLYSIILHHKTVTEKYETALTNWQVISSKGLIRGLSSMLNSLIIMDYHIYDLSKKKNSYKFSSDGEAIKNSVLARYEINFP
ncbi:TPA: hypothetical protein MAN81_000748 [Klebsiella pneumoniae]|uniref:hypothetical protein n=1 Tax=Klebsiella pneumoniae TaxID=573 RepID=UPI0020CC20E6|nr:hypothetical protein [Klebsiella pneumoniae]MCQ0835614.1 hypothetical protein [Klebsiella pneumoniae]HBS6876018.1 hypothetical protein [Klebsiella pneumoniae]